MTKRLINTTIMIMRPDDSAGRGGVSIGGVTAL